MEVCTKQGQGSNFDFLNMTSFSPNLINIGTGKDKTILNYANFLKTQINYYPSVNFDLSKPNGTKRKVLDVSIAKKLGWIAKTSLKEGTVKTEFYNAETSLKVKEVTIAETPQGDISVVTSLSDYQEFDGIKVAGKMVQSGGGQTAEFKLISYTPNKSFNKEYLGQ